jgi:hypothetical protein
MGVRFEHKKRSADCIIFKKPEASNVDAQIAVIESTKSVESEVIMSDDKENADVSATTQKKSTATVKAKGGKGRGRANKFEEESAVLKEQSSVNEPQQESVKVCIILTFYLTAY